MLTSLNVFTDCLVEVMVGSQWVSIVLIETSRSSTTFSYKGIVNKTIATVIDIIHILRMQHVLLEKVHGLCFPMAGSQR